MKTDHPPDLPFAELCAQGEEWASQGYYVFVKWDCAVCGDRQTFARPNVVHTSGECEVCGSITDLRETGGGLMLILSSAPASAMEEMVRRAEAEPPQFRQRLGNA